MIGLYNGSSLGKTKKEKGFVVMYHELRSFLKDFSPTEWMVLSCLALHSDSEGFSCPSIATIATETGLSERTVIQATKSLSLGESRGYTVLRVEERHCKTGRRTSNGYVILPEGFSRGAENSTVEGAENNTGEGAENNTIITLKNIHIEVDTPIVPKKGTKRDSIKMPVDDDPAKALFLAYRSVVFTDVLIQNQFLLGEWRNAHHVLRSMQSAKITPEQVEFATRNLVTKWGGRKDMVTINALWKHWSTAMSTDKKENWVVNVQNQVDRLWND
jgi:hypothetical protein